jgi:hypothetical protein
VKRKVHRIAADLASRIAQWEGTQAVLLGEAAESDVHDPYFTIEIDVYTRGAPPEPARRHEVFSDTQGFETSPISALDRFLVEDLPASVHYVDAAAVDRVLWRLGDSSWVFHEPGTTLFYRIARGEVLHSAGKWIEEARAQLQSIPPEFWRQIRLRAFAAAELSLAELRAATARSDSLFFLVSSGRLTRSIASFLFAANRQFEPPGRLLSERLAELKIIPDGFAGMIDNFLRPAPEITPTVKTEIADLIVRSLIPLA